MGARVSLGPPVGAMEEFAQPDMSETNRKYNPATARKYAIYLLSFDNFLIFVY
jgi:hypothetical protein